MSGKGKWSQSMVLLLLYFLAAAEGTSDLLSHLKRLEGKRHPFASPPGEREAARSYIKERFKEYGLDVAIHAFNTSVAHLGETRTVFGENVIGVVEAPVEEGKQGRPVLLVGADYDSAPFRPPLEDNGAGVGAMLEVARRYMAATGQEGEFTRNATIIFAAFDLNTREYVGSGTGWPGSHLFLEQWLKSHLSQSNLGFAGAIILDSISKFSHDNNSQYLPQGFQEAFPSAYDRISGEGFKADFLALMTRGTAQSTKLKEAFTGNYLKHRKGSRVRLQEVVLHSGMPLSIPTLQMMNHQAHYHFWTFKSSEQGQPNALPALLITDTDVHRKSAEDCPSPCSAETFLTKRCEEAIEQTCDGLLHTLLDLQAERKETGSGGQGSGGASVGVTMAASWLMTAFTLMLR